MLGSVNYF